MQVFHKFLENPYFNFEFHSYQKEACLFSNGRGKLMKARKFFLKKWFYLFFKKLNAIR